MAIQLSTGLRNELLDGNPFKTAMNGGYLHIYSGTPPANVNGGAGAATLLATIYSDGGAADAGLGFGTAADGILPKDPNETWDNSTAGNIATGEPAFYIFSATEADGTAVGDDATVLRFMGTVATVGADLNLSNAELTQGETQAISAFSVTVPASG